MKSKEGRDSICFCPVFRWSFPFETFVVSCMNGDLPADTFVGWGWEGKDLMEMKYDILNIQTFVCLSISLSHYHLYPILRYLAAGWCSSHPFTICHTGIVSEADMTLEILGPNASAILHSIRSYLAHHGLDL